MANFATTEIPMGYGISRPSDDSICFLTSVCPENE
jgi:hypothetical protein